MTFSVARNTFVANDDKSHSAGQRVILQPEIDKGQALQTVPKQLLTSGQKLFLTEHSEIPIFPIYSELKCKQIKRKKARFGFAKEHKLA